MSVMRKSQSMQNMMNDIDKKLYNFKLLKIKELPKDLYKKYVPCIRLSDYEKLPPKSIEIDKKNEIKNRQLAKQQINNQLKKSFDNCNKAIKQNKDRFEILNNYYAKAKVSKSELHFLELKYKIQQKVIFNNKKVNLKLLTEKNQVSMIILIINIDYFGDKNLRDLGIKKIKSYVENNDLPTIKLKFSDVPSELSNVKEYEKLHRNFCFDINNNASCNQYKSNGLHSQYYYLSRANKGNKKNNMSMDYSNKMQLNNEEDIRKYKQQEFLKKVLSVVRSNKKIEDVL